MTDSSRVFVSLLTNDSFLHGLLVLLKSLRLHSAFPIHVVVTPQVSKTSIARFKKLCDGVIHVDPIPSPYCSSVGGGEAAHWAPSEMTKLHIWNLTQFSKVVYIDADAMVVDRIDELFDIVVPFAAAPDVFPPDRFNAGVLVVEPNAEVFSSLCAALGTLPSYDGGDTGFLNAFFSDWYRSESDCRLSFGYNAQRTLHWMTFAKRPGYWMSISPLKIIHYSSSPKPWELKPVQSSMGELEWQWWQAFMA